MKRNTTKTVITTLGAALIAATPVLAKEKLNFAYGYPNNSAVGLAVEVPVPVRTGSGARGQTRLAFGQSTVFATLRAAEV